MRATFLLLALALQLTGAVIAYKGLAQGWKEVRQSETFMAPVKARLRRVSAAVANWWSTMLRRNQLKVNSARASATASSVTLSMSVTGGKTSNGPIDRDTDIREALDILNDRINETLRKIVAVDTRLDHDTRKLRASVNDIGDDIGSALRDHVEDQRTRSIHGLRTEIVGFTLLTFGSLIGGVVSLVGA